MSKQEKVAKIKKYIVKGVEYNNSADQRSLSLIPTNLLRMLGDKAIQGTEATSVKPHRNDIVLTGPDYDRLFTEVDKIALKSRNETKEVIISEYRDIEESYQTLISDYLGNSYRTIQQSIDDAILSSKKYE